MEVKLYRYTFRMKDTMNYKEISQTPWTTLTAEDLKSKPWMFSFGTVDWDYVELIDTEEKTINTVQL